MCAIATWLGMLVIATGLLSTMAPRAGADEEEDAPLVIKVYRVIDLVVPVANYPYEGTFLPGMGKAAPGASIGAATSGTGGMGGYRRHGRGDDGGKWRHGRRDVSRAR